MDEISRTLQEVPVAGLIPVVLLVLVGLLLWGAGRRVFRAGFVAAGLLLGAGLGWLIAGGFNLGVPSWIVIAIGAALFASLAAMTSRLVIAGALALVLGIAGPLAVIAVHEAQGGTVAGDAATQPAPLPEASPPPPTDPSIEDLEAWLRERVNEEVRSRLPGSLDQPFIFTPGEEGEEERMRIPEGLEEHFDQIRNYAERLVEAAREAWDDAPDSLRPILVAAALLGGFLGILIGALVPNFSAAIITAFSGSLLWLAGVRVLGERLTFAEAGWLPSTGTSMLLTWVIVALVGIGIQWTIARPGADKKS